MYSTLYSWSRVHRKPADKENDMSPTVIIYIYYIYVHIYDITPIVNNMAAPQ